jgi:hypothetical protein
MKKKELTPVELKKVVELRQFGVKWTEIEQETGVERRAAKRAYEEWEIDKKTKEQEAVRFRVAAEALHEHLDDLIRLAESLVRTIHIPEKLHEMDNADEALDRFWAIAIQGEPESSPKPETMERERIVWRNKMLFKSLQEHTQGKVSWEALEDWKKARNNSEEYARDLKLEAIRVIKNTLKNQRVLQERIRAVIGVKDVSEKMADGVREAIWRSILTDKPDKMGVLKGTSVVNEGRVWLAFYEGDVDTEIDFNDVELAKEVLSVCRLAVESLREKIGANLLQRLTDEVRHMQDSIRELEDSLDRLVLRPMLLRTQCNLCPV